MKLPALDSFTPRQRLLAWRVFRVLLSYAVIGFLILPPIIRVVAVKQLAKQLHREVSIRKIQLNPFALSVTVRGLLIKDKDGEPFVSWDEVYVNFQLSSLVRHPWVFKEISTSKPYVRVQVNKDYSLNFTDLIEQATTNTPVAKAPAKPLAFQIDRLHIGGAAASFTDLTMRSPFKRVIGPLDVNLEHFRTDPKSKNPYSFAGTTDGGEKFSWSGIFSLSPIRSQGELTLENLTLNKYAPLYQDFVRFEIRDGVISTRAAYELELSPSNRVARVTDSSFTLASLKVGNPGEAANIVEQQSFSVTGASMDAVAHSGSINSITATGGRLVLKRSQDNAVNVIELAKPTETATNAPGGVIYLLQSVTNAVAMLVNSTNAWSGTIHDVNFQHFSLSLEDLVNTRPAKLELDDISLTAKHISNVPGTNLTASLSLRWNTNGSIKTDIAASFAPPTVDVHITLDQLDLHPIDPYLESKINVLIIGSKLGMDGTVHLRTPKDQLPEVTFNGDVWLDDFNTVDGVLGEDLLKWQSVKIRGLAANLNPPSVAIKEIAVNDAYARVIIETNHTINLLAALNMANTNAALAEGDSNAPPVAVAAKPAAPAETTTNNSARAALPKITIDTVVITNTQMRFSDRSLTPNVNLSIQKANGTIAGLSSEDLQHADVNLQALVDNIGPAAITGTINPFSDHSTNDIKVAISDVDLTPTSPYGAKFAGYRIAKGKLSLDLAYHVVGRNLSSRNVVTLDQFTFGEKVPGPDATKLPVRLAIAILKDREGKIVLDVPIEGSLDDPQFRIGKVVTRVVVNILTKIVTSPFAMLGAVFGGHGDELSFQTFTPGLGELLPAEKEKLDSLVKGLYERPGLQLEIEGSIDPVADRDGLQRLGLDKLMRTRKWSSLSKSERASTTPEQLTLTPGERTDYVRKMYGEAQSRGEIDLAKLSSNTNTAAIAALLQPKPMDAQKGGAVQMQGRDTNAPTVLNEGSTGKLPAVADPMEFALLTTIPVTDADLQMLATTRAKSVRDYILSTGKVEADRLFLTESQPDGVKVQGNRAYLQFR